MHQAASYSIAIPGLRPIDAQLSIQLGKALLTKHPCDVSERCVVRLDFHQIKVLYTQSAVRIRALRSFAMTFESKMSRDFLSHPATKAETYIFFTACNSYVLRPHTAISGLPPTIILQCSTTL